MRANPVAGERSGLASDSTRAGSRAGVVGSGITASRLEGNRNASGCAPQPATSRAPPPGSWHESRGARARE
jgi:hypothetical protein